MKRILVVGASSFIGGHLWAKLLEENPELLVGTFCDNRPDLPQKSFSYLALLDITDEARVAHLLSTYEFDTIFHLGGISRVKDESSRMTQVNVLGTHNLLRYAPHGCRFVFASSATIYGLAFAEPHNEFTSVPRPRSVYAASKLGAEGLITAYEEMGRIHSTIVRLVANVGAGATHGVVPDLVRKALSDSPTLEVLGKYPGSEKPYVHVSDTARFFIEAARWGGHWVYNFSNDDVLTSLEIAEIVMKTAGISKPIVWNPAGNWAGDDKKVLVKNTYPPFDFEKKYPCSRLAVEKAVEELL